MEEELHEVVGQRLRRRNQRYTSPKRALVEVLASSGGPLTIPEIVSLDGSLATSSVYRNLAALEQAGVVSRIVTGQDHASYELSEQVGHHHHHLVCLDCGAITDFTLPAKVEDALDEALRRAARKQGYAPDAHRLDLTGTCPACR